MNRLQHIAASWWHLSKQQEFMQEKILTSTAQQHAQLGAQVLGYHLGVTALNTASCDHDPMQSIRTDLE
jgi:hypothetical protein